MIMVCRSLVRVLAQLHEPLDWSQAQLSYYTIAWHTVSATAMSAHVAF